MYPFWANRCHVTEDAYESDATPEAIGKFNKDAYHPAPGAVLALAAANLRDARDARTALAHEVLGHYGINTVTPGEKHALLDALLAVASDESSSLGGGRTGGSQA